MRNLEQVVRERNRAYHTLETGRDGERPGRIKEGVFGLEEFYRYKFNVVDFTAFLMIIRFRSFTVKLSTRYRVNVTKQQLYMQLMSESSYDYTERNRTATYAKKKSKTSEHSIHFGIIELHFVFTFLLQS